MKFIYNGHSRKSGVYLIRNILTNKIYIGSAKEFKRRSKQHYSDLKNKRHGNRHLQRAFNKDGEENFIFEILEVVDGTKENRREVEQTYLDKYYDGGKRCYNIINDADAPPSRKGKFVSEETRRKLSEAGKGRIVSEKTRKKLSKVNKGRKHTEEAKRKNRKAKKEFYKTEEGKKLIQDLSDQKRGKTYEELYGKTKAEEVKQKIRENKLIEMNKPEVKENLRKLLKGKTYEERFGVEKAREIKEKNSKARKGKYCGRESSGFKVYENIKLVSPSGEVFTKVEGICDFAKAHGLPYNRLGELLSGKRKTWHGWKVIDN